MIVVTGASGGIGRSVIPFLAQMDDILGIYFKKRPDIPETENVSFKKVDLTDDRSIQSFIKESKAKLEKITVVHFAAKSVDKLAAQLTPEEWDDVMNVNLKANFLLSRAFLPLMIQQKWGRLIHISSVVGVNGGPGTIAYAASKSGLLGLSKVLAREGARFNITSNVLTLGYFDVGLIETLTPEAKAKVVERIPSRKLGSAADIAQAVQLFIKSDYINGSVLNIDGAV